MLQSRYVERCSELGTQPLPDQPMEDVKANSLQPSIHTAFWDQPPQVECPCPGDCFAIAGEQSAGGADDYGSTLRFHRDLSQFVAFMQMESETTTSAAVLKTGSIAASSPASIQSRISRIPGYTSVTTTTVCICFQFCAVFTLIV